MLYVSCIYSCKIHCSGYITKSLTALTKSNLSVRQLNETIVLIISAALILVLQVIIQPVLLPTL